MSTAEKKTGQLGSWANLVICGGLSWGVNFWHATHATSGNAKVGVALALLCATGPVFSAGFASHNMSRSGGGTFKKLLTYVVFAMGMALSITAQAEAVAGVFGNIYLGVTFALMLDLSAFMSLHSIMSVPSVAASAASSAAPPVASSAGSSAMPSVASSADRLPNRPSTVSREPSASSVASSAKRPANARQASGGKAKKPAMDVRAEARSLLKETPDMSGADLARALGKSPSSGHVRTLRGELLEELRDAGELPSVRALGA